MSAWARVHDIIKMPRHPVHGTLSLKRQGRAVNRGWPSVEREGRL